MAKIAREVIERNVTREELRTSLDSLIVLNSQCLLAIYDGIIAISKGAHAEIALTRVRQSLADINAKCAAVTILMKQA